MALGSKNVVRKFELNESYRKIYPNEALIEITQQNVYEAVKAIIKTGQNVLVDSNDNLKTLTFRATGVQGQSGLANFACLYGLTARRNAYGGASSATADAISEGTSAFNGSSFQTKNAILATGGLFSFHTSSVVGYYRPWVAVPSASLHTVKIYSSNFKDETSVWAVFSGTKNSISYYVYVRENPIEQGKIQEWIIRNYS